MLSATCFAAIGFNSLLFSSDQLASPWCPAESVLEKKCAEWSRSGHWSPAVAVDLRGVSIIGATPTGMR